MLKDYEDKHLSTDELRVNNVNFDFNIKQGFSV